MVRFVRILVWHIKDLFIVEGVHPCPLDLIK
jgi:hypothetical protein